MGETCPSLDASWLPAGIAAGTLLSPDGRWGSCPSSPMGGTVSPAVFYVDRWHEEVMNWDCAEVEGFQLAFLEQEVVHPLLEELGS